MFSRTVHQTGKSESSVVRFLLTKDYSQAAIVRGAALRGLIGTAPRVKKCRRHYGCKISMPFRQDIDPESDAWYDQLTSQKLCSHRMLWMINKVRGWRLNREHSI